MHEFEVYSVNCTNTTRHVFATLPRSTDPITPPYKHVANLLHILKAIIKSFYRDFCLKKVYGRSIDFQVCVDLVCLASEDVGK